MVLQKFFLGENIPQMSQKLFSLYRADICPYTMHHNGKDSLAIEIGAVEQTPAMWLETHINHHYHPQVCPRYPLPNSSWVGCRASVAGGARTRDRCDSSLRNHFVYNTLYKGHGGLMVTSLVDFFTIFNKHFLLATSNLF